MGRLKGFGGEKHAANDILNTLHLVLLSSLPAHLPENITNTRQMLKHDGASLSDAI